MQDEREMEYKESNMNDKQSTRNESECRKQNNQRGGNEIDKRTQQLITKQERKKVERKGKK